jgi:ATP-binding cassette, subfamily C (CFTR/MRP), member 1
MTFWKSKPPPQPKPNTLIPEANANILSRLTFWWIGNLMSLGYKRPLEKDDLYVLNDTRIAKNVVNNFQNSWEKEYTRKDGKTPSILRAFNSSFGFKFWISGIYRLLNDMLLVTSPLVLQVYIFYFAAVSVT